MSQESVRYRSLSEIWVTLGASTAKTVIAQKVDSGGRSVGVPVIDGRRSHVENVTPDLQPCDTQSHQSSSKVAVLGRNHLVKGKFSELFY